MESSLNDCVNDLESRLPRLIPRRAIDAMANDCFEAGDYWVRLGRRALESDTRVNFPERAYGQYKLLEQLREILPRKSKEDQHEFAQLLDAGERLLELIGKIKPPPDGHLGFLRIVRTKFDFVVSDFGFSILDEQPTSCRFHSAAVNLELSHSVASSLSCEFGPEPSGSGAFWIEDLLYLNEDERWREIPQRLEMDTERQVDIWIGFLADCFKLYGSPVLANEPGIFERLAVAQANRDADYAREMDRVHATTQELSSTGGDA